MYHDLTPDPHPQPFLPLRGRGPLPEGITPSTDDRTTILEVAQAYPRFGPQRIYSQLRLDGHDIRIEVIQVVLAELGR